MQGDLTGGDEIERQQLRELALIDRVFGLEAQLAEVSVFMNPGRERFDTLERETEGLRQQLAALRGTATWRAGRLVLAPLRLIRRSRGR